MADAALRWLQSNAEVVGLVPSSPPSSTLSHKPQICTPPGSLCSMPSHSITLGSVATADGSEHKAHTERQSDKSGFQSSDGVAQGGNAELPDRRLAYDVIQRVRWHYVTNKCLKRVLEEDLLKVHTGELCGKDV